MSTTSFSPLGLNKSRELVRQFFFATDDSHLSHGDESSHIHRQSDNGEAAEAAAPRIELLVDGCIDVNR